MSKINLVASVRSFFNLPETATDAEVHEAMQTARDADSKETTTVATKKETSQEQGKGTEQEPNLAELLVSLVDKSNAPLIAGLKEIKTRLDALEKAPAASHTEGQSQAEALKKEELKSWQKDPVNIRAKAAATRTSFLPSKRAKMNN